jgi:multidrug efflux system membrane fusion protein
MLRHLSLAIALALITRLTTGCDSTPPVRAEPPPPKVEVQHPEARRVTDYDQYNGWLDAAATVEVRSRVRGHIEKVDFKDGDTVQKGQVLFELDPRTYQADVDRAKEQLRTYEAQLARAVAEEKRIRPMFEQKVAGESELDKAVADVKTFEAQVDSAKHEIDRRQLDLEYARITAPITGRIGRAMLTAGNLVNAGGSDPLLATIASVDPIDVYFNVDERALQRYLNAREQAAAGTRPATTTNALRTLKVPFNFGLETDDGFPRHGLLDFADNRVDPTTGTILVRGQTPNPQGLLIPGSRVRVRLPVSKPHDVTLVPDTALLADQDRRYLLVLDDKNVVHRCDVTPGKLLDDGSRVIEPAAAGGQQEFPLTPDSWVVTQGLQNARLNYPVEPVRPTTRPTTTQTARSTSP